MNATTPSPSVPAAARHHPLGGQLWRLLPFARPYWRRIALGLSTNALARFFDLLPMVIVGRVVDLITASTVAGAAPADPKPFALYGVAVLATFACLAVFQSVSDYALDTMAENVRHDLRVALYTHLQRQEAAYFENRQTGDLMSVVASDVDTLESFFSNVSTSLVRLAITFLGTYGILLWRDWRLAALLLAPLPLAVAAVRFFATRIQPQYRRARKAVGEVNAIIENNVSGIGVIQAYTAEDYQAGRVRGQSAEYRDASIAAASQRARFIPLIYAIAGLSFAGLIGVGGWLTVSGQGPSLGDFSTFMLLAMRLVLPLFVFGAIINQIQRSEAAAQRIFELLDRDPAIGDRPDATPLAKAPGSVEFRDVRFAYPGREQTLSGVNFRLETGKVLGVVGPTGAGKSTLVKLLLRSYEPSAGDILIDDRSISSITLASLRSHVGYVSQDAFLFFGTVRENIALGSPQATDDDIRHAAAVAGADEFIRGLPQGYDTLVGERGVKLSGGQRQRVSLARAVLRDPSLLLLDEATASVDTRTEEIIQQNLNRFRHGRMTLAVAHRLSTVRHADEIIVLVAGMVVERGTHDTLLAAGGIYAGLWAVQSGDIEVADVPEST